MTDRLLNGCSNGLNARFNGAFVSRMFAAYYSRPAQNFLTVDEVAKVFSNVETILPCQVSIPH